jgi:hypothetical protein
MNEQVEFTLAELQFIARLAQNLLSSAIEAGLDPGVVESVYYKTAEYI